MNKIPSFKPLSAFQERECCNSDDQTTECQQPLQQLNIPLASYQMDDDAPCCGPKPGPPSSPYEKPGYSINHFVDSFTETGVGRVPKVKTQLGFRDFVGTFRARIGVSRDKYKVAPGLYSVGRPGPESPVLVTANYKLSFDSLRGELSELDAWILVLDTRGVNVWCAAGKKTFSSEEVIRQVHSVGLEKLVSHRELILPQLGAPGISFHAVKKGCGFKVIWGPIKAADLKNYLRNGRKAEVSMRQLTFTMAERVVLIPVELYLMIKPSLIILAGVFLLSGIGPDIFSFSAAWLRGLNGSAAYMFGVLAGAIIVPALLPWLPIRQFFIKGILTGLVTSIAMTLFLGESITRLESLTLILLATSVSSYAAMNFTGATPYTSPSGVEKEMRQGIPLQLIAVIIAAVSWVAAPFL
jgi:hypothetical protein